MRYSIEGEPLPVAILDVEAGETIISQKGAMSWMSPNMRMQTKAGGGGLGKLLGRAVSGESIFVNRYTAEGGAGMIAFASTFPGSIRAFNIAPGQEIIAQKKSFLASTENVEMSVFFQKKLGSGFFGGEGFVMQRLSGYGVAFVEFDGYIKEYELGAGQQLIMDTGYLAAMTGTCSVDIQAIAGVKNMLFGGEGLFNTIVTGPGHVWVQSMPIAQMANSLIPYLPLNNNNN